MFQQGFRIAPRANFNTSIFGYIMHQMTAKAGIKKYGKAAKAALINEFAQLEALDVYKLLDPATPTKLQQAGALQAINLIKAKRDGNLKRRTVVGGRLQRLLYNRSMTASPTASTDAQMLLIMIDAHINRFIGTADVAGAYLKAYMKDYVLIKFAGASVDIFCAMNPRHSRFEVVKSGGKVLYVRLVRAIYGCVKLGLLWYDLFHSHLAKRGFVLNPYNSCIANCMIK